MKLKTIEKYIRYTDIPYPEIYQRAEKAGLKVERQKYDNGAIRERAYSPDGKHWVESCHYGQRLGEWNEYNY